MEESPSDESKLALQKRLNNVDFIVVDESSMLGCSLKQNSESFRDRMNDQDAFLLRMKMKTSILDGMPRFKLSFAKKCYAIGRLCKLRSIN